MQDGRQIDLSIYHQVRHEKLCEHIDRVGLVLCESGPAHRGKPPSD